MFERETVIHRRLLFGLTFTGLVAIMPHDHWTATLFAAAIATMPLAILLVWPYMLIAVPLMALPKLIRRAMSLWRKPGIMSKNHCVPSDAGNRAQGLSVRHGP